jgi:hypothetical protein
MSTLAEIEAAIESLPAPQLKELAAWLERRSEMSARERGQAASVRSLFGKTASGRKDGADNEGIDRDLASEAASGPA